MTIAQWTAFIMEWCERKGWNKNPDGSELVPGNMGMNLHSEITEAWEELRNGHKPTEVYGYSPFHEELKDFACGLKALEANPTIKPEGFPIELADLAIRLFHLCGYYGIDLEAMIELKMRYNETRPYRHGGKTA